MRQGLSLMDLVSEGNIGLIRAAEDYDPARGVRFSTHAKYWIRAAIQRARAGLLQSMRVKRHGIAKSKQRATVAATLTQFLGRWPTEEEVDNELGLSPAGRSYARKVERALGVRLAADLLSGDGEGFDMNQFPAPEGEEQVETSARMIDAFRYATDCLTDFEIKVINIRFPALGDPPTVREVAKELGCGRNWVHKTQLRALAKLREALIDSGINPGA
jgi:RNA polymerase primary sigma factor